MQGVVTGNKLLLKSSTCRQLMLRNPEVHLLKCGHMAKTSGPQSLVCGENCHGIPNKYTLPLSERQSITDNLAGDLICQPCRSSCPLRPAKNARVSTSTWIYGIPGLEDKDVVRRQKSILKTRIPPTTPGPLLTTKPRPFPSGTTFSIRSRSKRAIQSTSALSLESPEIYPVHLQTKKMANAMETLLARTRDDQQKRQDAARVRVSNPELRNPRRYAFDTSKKLLGTALNQGTKRGNDSGIVSGRDKVQIMSTPGRGVEAMFRIPGLTYPYQDTTPDVDMQDASVSHAQSRRPIAHPHSSSSHETSPQYPDYARIAAVNATLPGMHTFPDVPRTKRPAWYNPKLHGKTVMIPGLTTLRKGQATSFTGSSPMSATKSDIGGMSHLRSECDNTESEEHVEFYADDEMEAGALTPVYEPDYGSDEDAEGDNEEDAGGDNENENDSD